MFSHTVGFFGDTWAPVDQEMALFESVSDPIKMHVNGLQEFLFDFTVGEANSGGIVGFDGCEGGWGLPSSLRMTRSGNPPRALMNVALASDYMVELMMAVNILLTKWMGPLGVWYEAGVTPGVVDQSLRNWMPPARLQAWLSDRYGALLLIFRHMSLATYRMVTAGGVAAYYRKWEITGMSSLVGLTCC